MSLKEMIKKVLQKEFTKSAIIYIISTFINLSTPFFLLPILTRYLTASEYGTVSMVNATISFFLPFVSLGANTAIQRIVIEKNYKKDEYIFNCLLISILAEIVMVFIFYYNKKIVFQKIGVPSDYINEILIIILSTVVIDITLVILQMKKNEKKFAYFQNLMTISNFVFSSILIINYNLGLNGRIYGIMFSKLCFSILGFYIIKKEVGINFKIRTSYMKDSLFNYGIPLIPTSIKSIALTYTDKVFITNMVSLAETGIYSVGNQFALPILFLAQAFNLAYVPWLFENLKKDDKNIKIKIVKLTYIYFVVILIIVILWSFISIPIIKFISGKEFYGATSYVFWLSLGYSFTGMHMMVVNYIYFYKKTKLYSLITISVIIINIILNYFFINYFGVIGASQATAVTNFISFILTWCLVIKICDMPWFNIKEDKCIKIKKY